MKPVRIPSRQLPGHERHLESNSPVTLRTEVRAADRKVVRTLLTSTGLFYPYEIDVAIELLDDRIKWKDESIFHFLFADRGRESLGYVCYGPILMTDNRYDMYWIAVRKDQQGRGIGRRLLQEMERRIVGQSGRHVYVETSSRDDYEATRSFYGRNGYVEVARIPDFYKDNDSKIILMKMLS